MGRRAHRERVNLLRTANVSDVTYVLVDTGPNLSDGCFYDGAIHGLKLLIKRLRPWVPRVVDVHHAHEGQDVPLVLIVDGDASLVFELLTDRFLNSVCVEFRKEHKTQRGIGLLDRSQHGGHY